MKRSKRVQGMFVHLLTWSWIIGFTFVWVLPDDITHFIKPIVICGCMADVLRKKRKIRIDVFCGGIIVFGAYCAIRSLFANGNQWLVTLSFGANILYALCICVCEYEEEEYRYMLRMVKMASLMLATVVLCSNPLPSLPENNVLKLFSVEVNKNAVPYLIAPGSLVCMGQLLWKKRKTEKLVYALELAILVYAGIYPMSRGGFLSILLPAGLLVVDWLIQIIKQKEYNKLYVFIVLSNLCVAVGLLLLQGRYGERLLSMESYTYFSSRDTLAKEGIGLVRGSELFGKGFGYYQKMMNTSYGSHNCFVDVYVATGLIGVLLFCGIFVYLLVRLRNNAGRAWLGMGFICAMVESQMSYQFWIPIAMAYLLCNRERCEVWKE